MNQYGLVPQIVLTGPILEGLDAKLDPVTGKIAGDKMSKSLGNYVGVADAPEDQFGKLMSVTDDLMWRYYELLSGRTSAEIAALRAGHPKAAKVALAKEIVERFHGAEAARGAEAHFEQVHARRETPEDVAEVALALGGQPSLPLVAALADARLATSRSEARRLVAQGGVTVNGERATDPQAPLGAGEYLVKVGKRHFARLRVS
jgi:tyrosyl-tRNA synthetase